MGDNTITHKPSLFNSKYSTDELIFRNIYIVNSLIKATDAFQIIMKIRFSVMAWTNDKDINESIAF